MFDFEVRERADEDAGAANYDALYHGSPIAAAWDARFAAFVAERFSPGDRVLDLGCGPGSLWEHWRALERPGRLVGLDLSPEMVARARERHPDGEFVVGRVHELPFETGSFDLVIASSVLHHVPDVHLDSALAEVVRVLDEHGRVVGREPVESDFAQRSGWLSGAVMNFRHLAYRLTRTREYPEPPLGGHHHVFASDAFVAALGRRLGLTALERHFAFSSFVGRVRDPRVAAFALRMDALLAAYRGPMLHFAAENNLTTAASVLQSIALARVEELALADAQFLAHLQVATEEIARIYGEAAALPPSP